MVEINDEIYGTIYEPDMSAISMNTFDTIAVSSDAGRGYSKGDTIVYVPEEAWIYYDYTYEWVRDPNAKYVDFISVTQTTPAVGDTAVYDPGTDWNTIKFLAGEVSFGAAPFDYSSSVYPITDLLGSGIPYDDASANYNQRTKTTDVLWNANAACHGWYDDAEQFYSAGIHMNELNVYTADGADGTTYYFSPDVMLVVNGHQVKVNVNTGTRIGSYYYFDVGTVDVYDGVTVLGIDAPVAGKTPTTTDRTLCLNSAHTEELPLYVSRLTWFIDADGDNVCDEGEEALVWYDAEGNYDAEASGLNEDGTFKYNTTYKVSLSVALDEGAAGRLAPYTFKTSVDTGTAYKDAIMHYDTSGAPTDAVYAYPKTAVEPLTKYEATFTAKAGDTGMTFPFDPIPSNAANHFALSSYDYTDVAAGDAVGSNALEDGKSYIFNVTFKAEDGYTFPEDFAVIINGETLTSGVTISGIGDYLSIAYPFTLGGGTGMTVSGTATSFNSDTDDVTIQLIAEGTSEAAYEAVVQGNTANYSIAGVAPGTYTLKVMKLNHVTREYAITVSAENVTQDVKIHLKGDVTGDGRVNAVDLSRIKAHITLSKQITDTYQLQCANVAGSGDTVNAVDLSRVKAHISLTKPLW